VNYNIPPWITIKDFLTQINSMLPQVIEMEKEDEYIMGDKAHSSDK